MYVCNYCPLFCHGSSLWPYLYLYLHLPSFLSLVLSLIPYTPLLFLACSSIPCKLCPPIFSYPLLSSPLLPSLVLYCPIPTQLLSYTYQFISIQPFTFFYLISHSSYQLINHSLSPPSPFFIHTSSYHTIAITILHQGYYKLTPSTTAIHLHIIASIKKILLSTHPRLSFVFNILHKKINSNKNKLVFLIILIVI